MFVDKKKVLMNKSSLIMNLSEWLFKENHDCRQIEKREIMIAVRGRAIDKAQC